MEGKIALITGGARGIGAATAKELARRGAIVIINYLKSKKIASELAEEIRSLGGKAFTFEADMRDETEINSMVSSILKDFGRIDVMVSNANMNFAMKPFLYMSWGEFAQKLNDELRASFIISKAVIPSMIENGFGRLVYVSSTLSESPSPYFIAHGTAKGGLDTFSRYLAQEFGAFGITSNVIAPSMVETDATADVPEEVKAHWREATAVKRLATATDVANTIAFLAQPESSYVTGTYIPVAGGSLIR